MLTDKTVREAKACEKEYRLCDERGLYLRVAPSGRKTWTYRRQSKSGAQSQTLGVWPAMSLYQARMARDEAAGKVEQATAGTVTFRALAERFMDAIMRRSCTERHVERVEYRLKRYIYPEIGDTPVDTLTSPRIYQMIAEVERDGYIEEAHRIVGLVGQILRYGIPLGLAPQGDVTRDLRGSIAPIRSTPRAHLETPAEVAQLMRRIDVMPWRMTKAGLLLQAYTLVRPGELRHALWDEIDIDAAVWRIPAEKMKMRRLHIVPLSRQVIEILGKVRTTLSTESALVLHSIRSQTRPMSDMTLLSALRDLGYERSEMSVHGFRSIGSTLLNEAGWPPDAIEAQLAHYVGGTVRAAYNHAQYLPVRRVMLQWYADYLDALRDGQPVPPMPMH